MRVIFYDDPESESDIWEAELPVIPRIGEMVSLRVGDDYAKVGKVTGVDWCVYKSGACHVEIVLDLM